MCGEIGFLASRNFLEGGATSTCYVIDGLGVWRHALGGFWFLSFRFSSVRPSIVRDLPIFSNSPSCGTMSARRSSRRAPKKAAASLPAGVLTGLSSLVESNESLIARMLSVSDLPDDTAEAQQKLQSVLTDCMAMNDLSAEALLARFFDSSVLKAYCETRLGVSGKGNEATLAARIARAWAKPDFEPLPLPDHKNKSKRSSSEDEGDKADTTSKKSDNESAAVKIPKKKKRKVASSEEK